MDKEQERTLRALKTGLRAKAHIVNGGGIQYVASGAWKEADAQREAVANVATSKGMTAYAPSREKVFDAAKAFSIVKMAENNQALLQGARDLGPQRH